jgi:hypothetical protein
MTSAIRSRVFSELFHTKSQGVFEVRAPVWNGVADARFGIFVFLREKMAKTRRKQYAFVSHR